MMRHVRHQDETLAEIDLTEDGIDAMMAAGQPVDLGGPPAARNAVRFELFRDSAGQFWWQLTSSTDKIVATSDTIYVTKEDAARAIYAFMSAAAHAALVDRTDKAS